MPYYSTQTLETKIIQPPENKEYDRKNDRLQSEKAGNTIDFLHG